jgi:FixJ family two-component response regulator
MSLASTTRHRRETGVYSVIAVVDDDDQVRKAVVRLLCAAGLPARGYGSGSEFLRSWLTERPDCVVLDLQMPGLSGLEVLRALDNADAHLPTIIITAHDEPAARDECARRGAAAYLRKPLDDRVLLDAIDKALATQN